MSHCVLLEEAVVADADGEVPAAIAQHRTWFFILGALLALAGVLAIVFPLAGTLAVEVWAAAAFLVAGAAQIVHAFATREWRGLALSLLIGALYVIAGVLLWLNPLRGAVALTLVVAAAITVGGIFEVALGLRLRPASGWGWMVASGVLGIVAGLLIWQQLPGSAAWVLGLLLGMNLISSGASFIALAAMAGREPTQPGTSTTRPV